MFSLSVINAANMLLPFISLPYMVRIIGVANYGTYTYVYTIIQYLLLITSYGFIFSATKQISICRNDKKQISRIFTSVIICKLLLLCCALLISIVFLPFIFHSNEEIVMFWYGCGMLIGDILMPTYVYQGVEKMRYLTIIDIIPKIIFTVLIFVFIKKASDYEYVIIFNSLGSLIGGTLSIIIAYFKLNIRLVHIKFDNIIYQLKAGAAIFFSTLGINCYRNANVLILGLFCSDSAVGIYAGAEKIIKAIQSIVTPISQALFPHVSQQFSRMTSNRRRQYLFKLTFKIFWVLLFLTICTIIFAPVGCNLILGRAFVKAIPLIRIMSLVILFGGINYVLGIIGMMNHNRSNQFLKAVLIAGIISVVAMICFVQKYSYYSAAVAMVLAELILFLECITYIASNKFIKK